MSMPAQAIHSAVVTGLSHIRIVQYACHWATPLSYGANP